MRPPIIRSGLNIGTSRPIAGTGTRVTSPAVEAATTPQVTIPVTTTAPAATNVGGVAAAAAAAAAGGVSINPGTLAGGVVLGPDVIGGIFDDFEHHLRFANRTPLMLLPLRLEYRFRQTGRRPQLAITDDIAEMNARLDIMMSHLPAASRAPIERRFAREVEASVTLTDLRRRGFRETLAERSVPADRPKVRDLAQNAFELFAADERLLGKLPLSMFQTELLVRWYPDENFAEKGVPPASERETAALARLDGGLAGRNWWDTADITVLDAWQAFVAEVGAARAVHLKRNAGAVGSAGWEGHIGRIAALPAQVALFTVKNGVVTALATGKPIPQNAGEAAGAVAYTADALVGPSGNDSWLASFPSAIDAGMGIRITTTKLVEQAKAADWLLAIGLHRGADGTLDTGTAEIERLLESRIATGEFAFLAQDANTNNAPDQPTGYRRFEANIPAFTTRASAAERGAFGGQETSSDLLAEAFGIAPGLLHKVLDADDTGLEDARAMLRVIGPALLDDALDGSTVLEGVDENQFIDALAEGVVARGPLPSVRFGDCAYGVLPVADIRTVGGSAGTAGSKAKVFKFLADYAKAGRALLPGVADAQVPVLKPETDDPEAVFDAIMKTNRVSTRIEVANSKFDGNVAKAITCPYVYGSNEERRPASYLEALRNSPLIFLPDPTAADASWPLLYRLARMSLVRNLYSPILIDRIQFTGSIGAISQASPRMRSVLRDVDASVARLSSQSLAGGARINTVGISAEALTLVQRRSARFAAALQQLEAVAARPQGVAQLEVLMLEVVDLFQHRIDAFATGLAYAQLAEDRAKGEKGLAKGYYGLLGKLRPDSNTGGSDGYMLAPSTPQAVTAAVLRSAYLRHKEKGAFAIDLRSRRVRRALQLLDILSKGHSLSEALGMRGERFLHDAHADQHILPLRLQFPIRDQSQSEIAGSRMFDGVAFVESSTAPSNAELKAMKTQLADDIDALADIVMAEAAHLRGLGAADAANGWLRVLSGGTPPGRPSFLRTRRSGHASAHKVTLARKPVAPRSSANPREIAEPTLSEIAADALPAFGAASIAVVAASVEPGATGGQLAVRLRSDLGMRPLDLVIGGAAELQLRARHFAMRKLLEDSATAALLAPAGGIGAVLSGSTSLGVDLAAGSGDVVQLIDDAAAVRRLFQGARSINPGDLNAMAPAQFGELTEAEEVDMLLEASAALANRAAILKDALGPQVLAARTALANFETRLMQAAARLSDPAAAQSDINAAIAQAETVRRALLDALLPLAAYAEPGLLKVFSLDEALTDHAHSLAAGIAQALDRLDARQAKLAQEAMLPLSGSFTHPSATAAQNRLIDALRQALDGEALVILPPYSRPTQKTRANFTSRVALAGALSDWTPVREKTALLHRVAQMIPDTSAIPVAVDATLDDSDTPSAAQRSEAQAPRAEHIEHVFGPQDDLIGQGAWAGIVADEWTAMRPSDIQVAGLAINYDSPQSEPPHCLLLGVPPAGNTEEWDESKAAALVFEAVTWMKVRALPSSLRLTSGALFPNANQVAAKTDKKEGRRIPDKSPLKAQLSWVVGDGQVATVSSRTTVSQLGVNGAGIVERLGFSRIRE